MFSKMDWITEISESLLNYSFGRLAVMGAVTFVVITLVALLSLFSGVAAPMVITLVTLACAIVAAFRSATRPLAVGFFAMLLVTSVFERDFSMIWWIALKAIGGSAAAPYKRSAKERAKLAEWLALRKGRPLSLGPARTLLEHLGSRDCIGRFFPPESIPATGRDLIAEPGCSIYRYFALGAPDERGVSYGDEDHGWRWTYERLPTRTRLGTPNYLLRARPDPQLEMPGPIVARDGDGRVLIRDTDKAPWQTFSTPIPMMKRFRECVSIAADSTHPTDVRRWTSLPESAAMQRTCKGWWLPPPTTDDGDAVYDVRLQPPSTWPRISDHVILYRVLSPGRFEIRSLWGIRRYLLDADGNLHVTAENRWAEITDAPPESCELDIDITCAAPN